MPKLSSPILFLCLVTLLTGCSSAPKSLEEQAVLSVINSEVGIVSVNDNPFVGFYSTTVKPGRVKIKEGSQNIYCKIEAGYIYDILGTKCITKGRTNAAAELSAKQETEHEASEKRTYLSYKDALSKDVSIKTLDYMKSKFTNPSSRIFKDDPELLLSIIDNKLAPVIAKRNKEAEKIRLEREKSQKAAQKAREERNLKNYEQERSYVSNFRDSLSVGADTNCGLVIEVKSQLVKLAFPVKDYGNEHWIKRHVVFPPGYDCRFVNGQYMPPSYRYHL